MCELSTHSTTRSKTLNCVGAVIKWRGLRAEKSGANRRGNCTSGAENTALTLPTRTPQGNETPALARLRGHDPSFPRGNRADMAAVSTDGGEAFAKRILDLECRRVVWHGASDGDSTRTGADSSRWQLCLSLDGPYPISPDFDHAVPTMYDHIARYPAALRSPVWLCLAGLIAGLLAAEASFKKTGSWPWKPWRFSSFQTCISAALVVVATRMMLLHPWWTPGQRLCPRSWLRISASRPSHLLQTLSRCSRAS